MEAANERKEPSLDQYPVLSEFKDVFPNELPGLPPESELDFIIELKMVQNQFPKLRIG